MTSKQMGIDSPRGTPRSLARKKSIILPKEVEANISAKTIQMLGDKKLMPRAARNRLGSSLSGEALHMYIEELKKDQSNLRELSHLSHLKDEEEA